VSEGETKHCQRQYLVISRPLPLVSLSRGAWERSGRRAAWWTRSPSLAIQQITRQHYTSRRVWGTVGGCMYLCRTAFGRANTRPVQRHCHPPRAAPGVQGQYVIFYTPDGNDTVVRARDRDPRNHDRIEHVCSICSRARLVRHRQAYMLVDASRMYRARENHRAGRSIALRSTGHCMLCNTRHAKGKHAQRIIPLRGASHHCIRRWTVETA
jgi:hypothetical protein